MHKHFNQFSRKYLPDQKSLPILPSHSNKTYEKQFKLQLEIVLLRYYSKVPIEIPKFPRFNKKANWMNYQVSADIQ